MTQCIRIQYIGHYIHNSTMFALRAHSVLFLNVHKSGLSMSNTLHVAMIGGQSSDFSKG